MASCRFCEPWPPFSQHRQVRPPKYQLPPQLTRTLGIDPGGQGGQADGRLEGRARRIGAGHRLVQQRLALVVGQRAGTPAPTGPCTKRLASKLGPRPWHSRSPLRQSITTMAPLSSPITSRARFWMSASRVRRTSLPGVAGCRPRGPGARRGPGRRPRPWSAPASAAQLARPRPSRRPACRSGSPDGAADPGRARVGLAVFRSRSETLAT